MNPKDLNTGTCHFMPPQIMGGKSGIMGLFPPTNRENKACREHMNEEEFEKCRS
jgi:hypothetical protein